MFNASAGVTERVLLRLPWIMRTRSSSPTFALQLYSIAGANPNAVPGP